MTTKLKTRTDLVEYIGRLEASTELSSDGEYPSRWIRFNASQFIDTDSSLERETFETYLMEQYSVSVDYQNDCLSMSDGPCIVINHDGDVLDQDSGEWIIDSNEYETKSELLSLIEKWMEKSGYYPSIVRCDYHGNMFYVSTKDDSND